jgi:hypothetical protein
MRAATRASIQRLLSQRLDGAGHRVRALAGMEHAVDRQALVVQAQFAQLAEVRAASAMAPLSGRVTRITVVWPDRSSASSAALKACLLHLQARVRPQARGAAVVAGQKPGPGLGQAEQAQVCPVGAVSNTMWS